MNQITHVAGRRRLRFTTIAALGILSGLFVGCGQPAPITEYTIDERVPESLQNEQRMLGAIVPKDAAVWFFKVSGPAAAVDSIVQPVQQVVQSVQFNDRGEPVIDPPSDWQPLAGSGMTFAKYDIPTEENLLQMTVTRLGNQGDWDELVKANVNRWRGQMALSPSEERWAGGEPLEVEAASDEGGVWVDLTGEPEAGGSSLPPMMSGMSPPFAGNATSPDVAPPASATPPVATAESTTSDKEPEYELPEGWRKGRSGGMRLAAFEVGEDETMTEITLIRAGGDLRGNMKMWAGQVKLTDDAEAAIDTSIEKAEELTVDGQAAQRFYIEGAGDQARAIDVVVVESEEPNQPQLFIKMSGPAAQVREQAAAFGKFLESLQF